MNNEKHFELEVYGNASQKIVKKIFTSRDHFEMTLLEILSHNDIPVASTCLGLGQCLKCVVNCDVISCQVSLKEFLKSQSTQRIYIDYL